MAAPRNRKDPSRVLLLHFGQMGDAVMALPAALALRARFPQAALTVLTARGGDAIFRMAGFEDVQVAERARWKQQPLSALWGIPRLWAQLVAGRFQLAVDLHSYIETNWLTFLAGIPRRCAMLRPTRSMPSLINLKPPPDATDGRLVDRYCTVLEPLGIQVANRTPSLDPPPGARAQAVEQFTAWAREETTRPVVRGAAPVRGRSSPSPPRLGSLPALGICPGAGHPSRRWKPEHFAALARAAVERLGARVAVFAGPEETRRQLAAYAGLPHLRILGGLSVEELAAALALCRVVVTNPTGPSHIAAAVGARVLTLGEIPAFDPVPRPPGRVVALRSLPAITPAAAFAALAELWG